MITRKDYMDGKVEFADYYREVAKTAGVSYQGVKLSFLQRVKQCIKNGDEHLNGIPLKEWDSRAFSLLPTIKAAFKKHGDCDTLAGRVCLIKQAARDAVGPPVKPVCPNCDQWQDPDCLNECKKRGFA